MRASAGGIEGVDIAQINNFTQVVKKFQEAGFWIVALEADGEKNLWDVDLRGMPLGLVVGGEHTGVRKSSAFFVRCGVEDTIKRGDKFS